MKIQQFGHAAFRCSDLEKSLTFYRDTLGLKEKFRLYYSDLIDFMYKEQEEKGKPVDAEYVAMAETKRDKIWLSYLEITEGTFIELFDEEGATEFSLSGGHKFNYQHMALIVDDIHELHDKLVAAGVKIDRGPNFGMDLTWQMWIRDPDGNRIEWMQYTNESMQLAGRMDGK